MAYPPPVQATNRTNATPQLDTHAADHNSNGLAINDIVAHVQAQDAANANALANKLGPSSTTGPYVGNWGAGAPLVVRAGHASGTTSSFGDFNVTFQTAFPAGVLAVTVTPGGDTNNPAICAWWPFVQAVYTTGITLWAMAPDGWPGAGGHPPGRAALWTLASQPIAFDYIAIGV